MFLPSFVKIDTASADVEAHPQHHKIDYETVFQCRQLGRGDAGSADGALRRRNQNGSPRQDGSWPRHVRSTRCDRSAACGRKRHIHTTVAQEGAAATTGSREVSAKNAAAHTAGNTLAAPSPKCSVENQQRQKVQRRKRSGQPPSPPGTPLGNLYCLLFLRQPLHPQQILHVTMGPAATPAPLCVAGALPTSQHPVFRSLSPV